MMDKFRNQSGFSLMETLAALLILVLLVAGVGAGIQAGSRVYREASFESDSAALAQILNTALEDILRWSRDVTVAEDGNFVFTNADYGIRDAGFCDIMDKASDGVLQMQERHSGKTVVPVDPGAYSGLALSELEIRYSPREGPGAAGGYFEIRYTIIDPENPEQMHRVETVVRHMNDKQES